MRPTLLRIHLPPLHRRHLVPSSKRATERRFRRIPNPTGNIRNRRAAVPQQLRRPVEAAGAPPTRWNRSAKADRDRFGKITHAPRPPGIGMNGRHRRVDPAVDRAGQPPVPCRASVAQVRSNWTKMTSSNREIIAAAPARGLNASSRMKWQLSSSHSNGRSRNPFSTSTGGSTDSNRCDSTVESEVAAQPGSVAAPDRQALAIVVLGARSVTRLAGTRPVGDDMAMTMHQHVGLPATRDTARRPPLRSPRCRCG